MRSSRNPWTDSHWNWHGWWDRGTLYLCKCHYTTIGWKPFYPPPRRVHGVQSGSASFYRATVCNATSGIAARKPSVCPSDKRVNCDKTKGSSAHIITPHERPFIVIFSQEEWLMKKTPSTWNFGSNWPRWSENADFQSIFARSASAVTPSKKVQLTLIESPLRAFQIA